MSSRLIAFDHAVHAANVWVDDIADAYHTDDRGFAYRVLRTWLHRLRDRLTVPATASFAAPLPDLLRGIYYQGWDPDKVPELYGVEDYVERFAWDTGIPRQDVRTAAMTVTAVAIHHLTPAPVDQALAQLPPDFRALLRPRIQHRPSDVWPNDV